jgi:hypothetical protein
MQAKLGAKHAFVNFRQHVNKQDHAEDVPQTQLQKANKKQGGQPKGNL